MSDSNVETRVVKMEFDNAKFEKEVKESINTIDKFDKKLRFEGVSNSIEKVTKSFSALEVSAITAIANITNRFVNLGIRMVKSLSVDNITAGWDKFGEKTVAVATMAAQKIKIAGKELTNYSEKMEAINEQLDKLNWFTDETSYNFTDMVNSIGKFTAAGQDLDVSVKAMMGIANWAALSGQNATKASSAMYQLAQAMGKGYVQLIDWKSIQNLSMDTVEFREAVLDTAVSMGELTKEADKFITKTGKKFTINQFAEELNSKWFTTDVLVKSLGKYSEAIERIYEISQETGKTASEVMQRYGSELDAFGLKAFKAAQEARTLADAIVSVKDAVSTGWMNTAEKIFGGYDESKELWTDLANELYDVFAEGGNFRNEILGLWSDLGGRADLFKHGDEDQGAFWNIYDSVIAVKQTIANAWNSIFPKSMFESYNDQVNDLANNFKIFTERLKAYTATIKNSLESNKKLYNIMQGLFSLIKIGSLALNGIRYALDPILTLAKDLFSDITDRLSYLVSHTQIMESVTEKINKVFIKLHDTIESVIEVVNPRAVLGEILNFLINIKNTVKNNAPLTEFANTFKSFFESLKENGANAENFARIMNGIVSIFVIASKIINEVIKLVSKYLLPVLNVLTNLLSKIIAFAGGALTHILALVGDIFVLIDELLGASSINDAGNTLNEFINNLKKNIASAKPLLKGFIDIFKSLVDTILLIPTLLDKASVAITGKSISENLNKLVTDIKTSIDNFNAGTINGDTKQFEPFVMLIDGIIEFFKGIKSVISGLVSTAGLVLKEIGKILQFIGELLTGIVDGIDKETLKGFARAVVILGALLGIFVLLNNIIWGLQSLVNPIAYGFTSIADGLEDFGKSSFFNSIGYILQSVGVMFTGIAIALNVISKSMDLTLVFKTLENIVKFGALLVAVFIAIKFVKKILEKKNPFALVRNVEESVDEIDDASEDRKDNLAMAAKLAAIGSMIKSIGFAMMEVALAMSVIGKIPEQDMWKGLSALALFGGVVAGITIVTGVFGKETEKSNKKEVKKKSNSIKNISTLMLTVAIAFKTLSKALNTISAIDTGKLWISVGVIATVMAVITACMGLLTALSRTQVKSNSLIAALGLNGIGAAGVKNDSASSMTSDNGKGIQGLMIGVSLLLLSIAASIGILSSINPGKMWSGIGAISVLLVQITAMVILVSKFATSTSQSNNSNTIDKQNASIVKMFNAITKMIMAISLSVALLSVLNPGKMWSAIGALSLIMAQIAAMVIIISTIGKGTAGKDVTGNVKQIAAVMVSVGVMVAGIAILANQPISGVIAATVAIATIMGSIAAMLIIVNTVAKGSGSMKKVGANMLELGGIITSVVMLIAGMAVLANLPLSGIIAGTASMTIMFANLAAALIVITKYTKSMSVGQVAGVTTLLVGLSVTMIAFGAAMSMLGGIDWKTITAAALSFSICLGTVVAALSLLTLAGVTPESMIGFSVAISILSVSMYVFAAAMRKFESVSWESIGKGAAVVAGAFVLLGLAAAILKPVASTILIISTGFALMGAGMYMIAMSLPLFIENFMAFATFINENSDTLIGAIQGLAVILVEGFLEGINMLVKKLSSMLPEIFTLIETFILGVSDLIINDGPALIEAIITLIDSTLASLAEHIDSIMESLMAILLAVLDAVSANIKDISNKIIDIIIKLIQVLTQRLPDIIKVLVDFLIVLITELFKNLGKLLDATLPLLFDFIIDLISKLIKYIVPFAAAVTKLVLILISTVLRLTLQASGFLASELIAFFGGFILLIVQVIKGMSNVIYEAVKYIFVIIIQTISKVLRDVFPMLASAGKIIGLSLLSGVLDAMRSNKIFKDFLKFIGLDLDKAVNSLDESIAEETKKLEEHGSAQNVVNAIENAGNEIMGTVDQVTTFMGEITDKGLSQINDTVNDSLSGITETVSTFSNQIGGYMADGLEEGAEENKNIAEKAGTEISNAAIEGAREAAGVHSPSTEFIEIGKYMCEGLKVGIEENQNTVIQSVIDMMNDIILSAVDIIDAALSEDLLTITPVIDLSQVRSGVNDIAQLMTNAGGSGLSVSGNLADIASNELSSSKSSNASSVINNTSNDVFNTTFNVTTNNPQEFSEDVDKELQRQRVLAKLAKGGAY